MNKYKTASLKQNKTKQNKAKTNQDVQMTLQKK